MDQEDVNVTEIMENANGTSFQNMDQKYENATDVLSATDNENFEKFSGMKIIQVIIASVGMITNIVVVIVFLNDRKLRRKIPNICIINQVGYSYSYIFTSWKLK